MNKKDKMLIGKYWIPISHHTITDDTQIISSIGFSILSYLLTLAIDNDIVRDITPSIIQHGTNTKDIRTIKKYMTILKEYGLIKVDCNINKLKKNDIISIEVPYKSQTINNSTYIRVYKDMYFNYINKIGATGWLLLCTLIFYYNKKKQFAFPKYMTLMGSMGISKSTLSKYINILKSNKLIKTSNSGSYCKIDSNDNEIWLNSINKYYLLFPLL